MIEKELTVEQMEIDLEILDRIVYDQTLDHINNKLKPIGLKVEYIEEQQYLVLEEIKIDLIDIKLWYNYFFKVCDYKNDLKPIFDQIRNSDIFKQNVLDYGYKIKDYILENLEESFNDPLYQQDFYNGYYINKDLSRLNNDLLSDLLKTIENFYFKSRGF